MVRGLQNPVRGVQLSSSPPNFMTLKPEQLEELETRCAKDEFGQPLVCYGCKWGASIREEDIRTLFPGIPVEWMCLHCTRNPKREEFWSKRTPQDRFNSEQRYGLVKAPADLYCTMDISDQYEKWFDMQEKKS